MRSADRCRYGRHKLDLQRDTRHAPAITTMVNDVSLLARRASSNLIALGQDVGTMRDKREGGNDVERAAGGLGGGWREINSARACVSACSAIVAQKVRGRESGREKEREGREERRKCARKCHCPV